ncbi:taurine ABC transporter substrate-binding protein [Candidimonas nitroreducens]|uniref:Taurine ABC transporter substrate-binding protein n=2 Tax=Candidimonas nitroreducens TaxID=683354 RepID=A0A225MLK6_9BURK|nr:taurine ABC transporter substrate-binding protein [Candidimonas nitroreducens]
MGALLLSIASITTARAAEKVLIATYGDPVPAQMAAHDGKFSKATGWNVDWRKFASGTDVIAAMASGDVSIAELGSSPLAIAATQGVDLKVFMIDYVIGKSESLIVRNGSGVGSLADLKGKRVAVPVGSTAHFSLMGALKHAGIQSNELTILNMSPDQIVAAWQQAAIDAAFVWPPAQTEILKTGKRLIGADDVAKWGYPTFNVWVVNTKFAESHAQSLEAFIRAVEEANQAYLKQPSAWTADSQPVKSIAAETGAQPDQVVEVIKGYTFLPLAEQATPEWLGKAIPQTIKKTADFLVSAGRLAHASDDYSNVVDLKYLNKAMK